jgi:endonuclease/exonuclease/phosphatase family metal-dependent hydrolase
MRFTKTVRGIARALAFLLLSTALLFWLPPHSQAAGKSTVKVMQQNMDAGTDLGFITNATDPKSLLIGLVKTVLEVAASRIPQREALLAEEIANLQPDLVALQEVTLYRKGPLGQPPATEVMYNQLQSLMDALGQRGLHYEVVTVNNLMDAELPTPLGFDFRMTDRDAMLARTDLPPSDFAISNVQQGIYQAEWSFGIIPVPRGWMTVDVQIGVAAFRFANTHLESPPAPSDIQVAQATELMQILSGTTMPVALLGDFNANAEPGQDHYPTTDVILEAGFVDAWHALHPLDTGYTWPLHGEDPSTSSEQPYERIDLIFLRGLGAADVFKTGGWHSSSGLWLSDHNGVFAYVPMPEL